MAQQKIKMVNFRIDRGIRLHGVSYFPGKNGKLSIVSIQEPLAKELVKASKGEIVTAKATISVKQPSTEDDLDAAFVDDEGDDKQDQGKK